MRGQAMKTTLDDVAREAGVSRATVDRVVNERGNVRQSTVERVHRALYSTHYLVDPLLVAAKTQALRFDFVLPVSETDASFFDTVHAEFDALAPHFASLNATVNLHSVGHGSPKIFADRLLELSADTDGMAFAAPDHPLVRNAVNIIAQRQIGCVSLINDISGTSRHGYAGVDNRAAGRTVGLLMGRFLSHSKTGKIALFTGSHLYRGNEEREAGFKSILRERFPQFKIIAMPVMHDDNALSEQLTREAMAQEAGLVGIYNDVGGGSAGIVKALTAAGREGDIVFIAHELNERTRSYLVEGSIDAIIDQDLKHQIYNAIEMLAHHKRHQEITAGILQPRFEIFVSENIV